MDPSPDRIRSALLLTNRLVGLETKPLLASEFWALVGRVDPGELLRLDVAAIAARAGVDGEQAQRLRALLDADTAMSFEQERLEDGGVSLISALDDRFPQALRDRLGPACPAFLLLAGPTESLGQPALGIVGSPDAGDDALAVARQAAELAVQQGWAVVSGLAGGADQAAIAGTTDAGGVVIGVPAEGILTASRNSEVRARVHAGRLCLASPFSPSAPARPGSALGRNKIVYALSRVAFVVACEQGSGDTWVGATEALDQQYAPVTAWTGQGATDGNAALVKHGARAISNPSDLFA